MDRVSANMVNDLERTDVGFGEFSQRAGCPNELGQDENFITGVEWWRWDSMEVRHSLIVFLSELQ